MPQEWPLSPAPHGTRAATAPSGTFEKTCLIRQGCRRGKCSGRGEEAQVSVPGWFDFPALNPSHLGQGRGVSLTFRDFRSAGFL